MNTTDGTGQVDTAAPARTYRIKPFYRIVIPLTGFLTFISASFPCVAALLTPSGSLPIEGKVAIFLVFFSLAGASAWFVAYFVNWRMTITNDALETSSWLVKRHLLRDEIAGRRTVNTKSARGKTIVIVPLAANLKNIYVPYQIIEDNTAFPAWFSNLRDLDARDLQDSTAAIATNAGLGATSTERLHNLAVAKKVTNGLYLVTIGLVLWSLVVPFPHPLVIAGLAVIPALAIILALILRGLFRLGSRTNDARANLAMVFVLPAFAILVRMLFDNHLVNWLPLIGAAVLFAGLSVTAVAISRLRLQQQPLTLLVIGLGTGLYAFGTIGEANALLDSSAITEFHSRVLDKHVSRGKVTSYHLRLAPWGPLPEAEDVKVPSSIYDRLEPGDLACVDLRHGALDMPWFTIQACR